MTSQPPQRTPWLRRTLRRFAPCGLTAALLASTIPAHAAAPAAAAARLTIDAAAPGHPVPTTLHGIFFEDINYGADGGLYAELIQNRSFEHRDPRFGWRDHSSGPGRGQATVVSDGALHPANPHFIRLTSASPTGAAFGVANGGFDGIALRRGARYRLSLQARSASPIFLQAGLGIPGSPPLGTTTRLGPLAPGWNVFETEWTSPRSVTNAELRLTLEGPGTADLDVVSLMPADTFKGRRNGMRADLAQALADLRPGFLRFPGGCVVEGRDLANAYRWKDTLGPLAERRQNWNLWQDPGSPQYHQTYGLGFLEYFQLAEDLGAAPLPVLNCGMSCQARGGTHVPLDQLDPWVQDALDLVEFANGAETSPWGARRAQLGHPAPFGLRFLAVGNEQWNQEYFDRYTVFQRALKARYPDLKLISTAGPFVGDALWEFAWNKFRTGTPADVVDEHYYVPPRWLLENVDRYATYDRQGPHIFVGEFAGHDGRGRRNNLRAALSEAAYLTGLVRHSDVVEMASYAPLFGKFGHDQWHPNLIWFDNTRVVRTPSYHAQAQFGRNRPGIVLPTRVEAPTRIATAAGAVGVGTWNTQAEFRDLRVTAPDGSVLYESNFTRDGTRGWSFAEGRWSVADGALRQTAEASDLRAVVGDPGWTDYTFSLKARKLGGQEGFLILFHSPDTENPVWWNLGGWNNTEHSLQGQGMVERHVRGRIETGRWYDIRIELRGGRVRAYLDDQLVHEAEQRPVGTFFACAGRDDASRELVVQLVNPFPEPLAVAIEVQGGPDLRRTARTTTLSHRDAGAENSLARPDNVTPRSGEFRGVSRRFEYPLPGNALVTLRCPYSPDRP